MRIYYDKFNGLSHFIIRRSCAIFVPLHVFNVIHQHTYKSSNANIMNWFDNKVIGGGVLRQTDILLTEKKSLQTYLS